MYATHGREQDSKNYRDHKLELYDTGEMTFEEMISEIERVFVCDPLKLEMIRRDVCVDVVGTSVDWFKTHARVEFKRNIREIGFMMITAKRGETYYLGVKPNQFRFYNKVAERLYQYGWMVRQAKKSGCPILSFEEIFGHSAEAVITRVERQYGGTQCGGTLGSLLKLNRTSPFEPLKFLSSPGREISPIGMDSTQYWAVQHLQRMAHQNSLQYVRSHMSELVGSKNIKKTWDRYSPYLCPGEDDHKIDEHILHELFLKSTKLQMAFPATDPLRPAMLNDVSDALLWRAIHSDRRVQNNPLRPTVTDGAI
jgi:hypothetical protein